MAATDLFGESIEPESQSQPPGEACPQCGSTQTEPILTPELQHYAKLICNRGHFIRWISKPDGDKARRPASHKDLVKKYGRGFCEVCLRREGQLPNGQTLEGHHIVEFADGGSEQGDNVAVYCTGCHRLIHLIRNYFVKQEDVK